jgi:hypothetical protein
MCNRGRSTAQLVPPSGKKARSPKKLKKATFPWDFLPATQWTEDAARGQYRAEIAEKENFVNFYNYLLDAGFAACTIRFLYALVTLGNLAVF